MATLILTAVGTAIGGPLGGAIGALIGRQVDQSILGGRKVEGPRLKDLSIQTSSYGNALPLHFGTMRAAGTVIWSTDLIEHSEKSGGGKGRPSVTTYSYTASFAVALASRPIAGIGRVWADGNLLRGAAGDLKVGGTMRVHTGYGEQALDPLLAQAEGALCPAYRHCAYVVFEDLELGNFGNRLPSLTFEIFADTGACSITSIIGDIMPEARVDDLNIALAGFSIDQGSIGDTLATISETIPLNCHANGTELTIRPADAAFPATVPMLPQPAASQDQRADTAAIDGWSRKRYPLPRTGQCALRYYDLARDYQPGLQRSIGRAGQGELSIIELPAALSAASARTFANAAGRRAAQAADTISYRITEIDATLGPGAFVTLPVTSGLWRIVQWEWQKDGLLLELQACTGRDAATVAASTIDAGRPNVAPDLISGPTVLDAFELPWDGTGSGVTPALFAAASSSESGWTGASLFVSPDGSSENLTALGTTGRARALIGRTLDALPAASPLFVDRWSSVDVRLTADDLTLDECTLHQMLTGSNRAMIGDEIIQFGAAQPLGAGVWRLGNLLRGRGGTEWAIGAHTTGERFALLDRGLLNLDAVLVGDAATARVVAVGLGDTTPAQSSIRSAGMTLRSLSPVHGRMARSATGDLVLSWTRRARGAWQWRDGVETPLNEESELYEIGFGDPETPAVRWRVKEATLTIPAAQAAQLVTIAPLGAFYIHQLSRDLPSAPLSIPLFA